MSSSPPSDPNEAFYNQHAQDFAERTLELDMEALYRPFLARLQPGARILDAGCGPGRDVLAFTQHGFEVVGMDASEEMVRLARANTQQEIHQLRFEDVTWVEEFDGIWACASLLHVPEAHLPDVFRQLAQALKPGGMLYASFKYGDGERTDGARRFTDLTEAGLTRLLQHAPDLRLEKQWRTTDVRPDRPHETWLNFILRKAETDQA